MPTTEIARRTAEEIVEAYLEHDRKNYEKSAHHFAQVFKHLFPHICRDRIEKAARAYTDALRNHDPIEEGGFSKSEQLNHRGWSQVRSSLLRMCKALDLPEDYARETTEFFRHHGIGYSQFILHMLSSDKIFTNSIIANNKLSLILGGLYLACVGCHNAHTEYGIELGKKLMTIYYSVILENMTR